MRVRTTRDLAAAARGRRQSKGWSQAETAMTAGVSRKWLVDFENGKSNVDLAAVLRLMDALELSLHTDAPRVADSRIDLDDLLDDYLR
jgi:transcriptional regulator with XRE-family HTH domain